MYPFIRMAYQLWKGRNLPALGPFDTHVSEHLCLPWDLDMWNELNNGRTLTLYDLGRIPLAQRAGLVDMLRRERWALTMAGCSVRYRKRVKAFDRVTMKSRLVGWDARFMYLEQSMWRPDGTCTSHVLYRSAVTDKNGIVPMDQVLRAIQFVGEPPAPPAWVTAWIEAEAQRPWPPMQET